MDMVKENYQNSSNRPFQILTGLVFFTWWIGLGGSQLYLAPALIWLFYVGYLIAKERFHLVLENGVSRFLDWSSGNGNRIVIRFLALNFILWIIFVLIKYYSFNYYTYDAGIYHNIVFNLSNGEFFSSFHNVNFLGNHFNINLVLVAPLYKIIPHSHWLMILKVSAYLVSAILIFRLCKELLPAENYKKWALVLLILWLFLYKPIVNSVRYEFQGSCLSLPFIFYAFLCLHREKWMRFGITMMLLLGFKEHLASVWIGFGCYLVLATPRKKLGIALIIFGIAALYIIMEQLMPWARNYTDTWRPNLEPFRHWQAKILYGIKLILPFAFLPLLFWKYGIMAGPPVGINLISSSPTMYSSHYHYDDVASCLLFIATILAIKDLKFKELWRNFGSKRWVQLILVFCFVFFLTTFPKSNLRFIRESLPESKHFELKSEINRFASSIAPSDRIAVLDVLGIHFNHREIQVFASQANENCLKENRTAIMDKIGEKPEIDYVVLAQGVGSYNLNNFDQCLQDLRRSDRYKELEGYRHLMVFKHQP